LKTKGIYFLYRVLQAFALPVLFLYYLFRGLRDRAYWKSLPQRFGFLPDSFNQTGPGAIWLHAVSVGEAIASVELVRRLRAEFPQTAIFVSTSTIAGRATAAQKFATLADGVFFAPVDYVFAVRRVLRMLKPSVLVVLETEIWPNLFREIKRTGAGLAIVNGRISDKALLRYRRFRWFFGGVLPSVDCVLAQTAEIRGRFVSLGALAPRTRTAGNLKYDFEPSAPDPKSPAVLYLQQWKDARIWIAASTVAPAAAGDPDEDDVVVEAFRELAPQHPGLLLILAPRKPERFDIVARKLEAAGIAYDRRSALPASGGTLPRVLLLDSIGELARLFALADVVFMGGTLASRGGHNILEPALFGKPVIAGPHMENFRDIAQQFRTFGAYLEISDAAQLGNTVGQLLSDPPRAKDIGRIALRCAQASRGASALALQEIRKLHTLHLPAYLPAQPWRSVRRWLSYLWIGGGRRRQESGLRAQRHIDCPVISVGNLTMGGTGKTPCVLRLAQMLKQNGHHPGILTRGYGRKSPDEHMIVPPGEVTRTEITGDEPQIFIRSGLAPVGIGPDRYVTGMELRRQFGSDIMVLDDGFQHLRLFRNLDIVLVDGLHPFGGRAVFPLGRLREPLEGIARADVVIITRSDLTDNAAAIEQVIRQYNDRAPVFRAWSRPEAWVNHQSGERYPPEQKPFERAAAFCGLGNPQSLRRTLARLGVEPVEWVEYADHHRYRPKELRLLAEQSRRSGADALVTTEKDAVNLSELADELVAPLPLYWLQVSLAIDREDELWEIIARI
jgi:tetraacyldisaccharide 4'-kinase